MGGDFNPLKDLFFAHQDINSELKSLNNINSFPALLILSLSLAWVCAAELDLEIRGGVVVM